VRKVPADHLFKLFDVFPVEVRQFLPSLVGQLRKWLPLVETMENIYVPLLPKIFDPPIGAVRPFAKFSNEGYDRVVEALEARPGLRDVIPLICHLRSKAGIHTKTRIHVTEEGDGIRFEIVKQEDVNLLAIKIVEKARYMLMIEAFSYEGRFVD
jgi:hypothetical protein